MSNSNSFLIELGNPPWKRPILFLCALAKRSAMFSAHYVPIPDNYSEKLFYCKERNCSLSLRTTITWYSWPSSTAVYAPFPIDLVMSERCTEKSKILHETSSAGATIQTGGQVPVPASDTLSEQTYDIDEAAGIIFQEPDAASPLADGRTGTWHVVEWECNFGNGCDEDIWYDLDDELPICAMGEVEITNFVQLVRYCNHLTDVSGLWFPCL